MANTPFSEIRQFIRTVLGDYDSENLMYSDDVLNGHIRFFLLLEESGGLSEDGTTLTFTSELTNHQKALVALNSALNIISPNPDTFSYRNAILSVTRKGYHQLRSSLTKLLDKINGGSLSIAYQTDLEAMLRSPENFIRDFEIAL